MDSLTQRETFAHYLMTEIAKLPPERQDRVSILTGALCLTSLGNGYSDADLLEAVTLIYSFLSFFKEKANGHSQVH